MIIGQFGDSLMEGDAIVGTMLDALRELDLERDTIVVLASDNGPPGCGRARIRRDMPDIGLRARIVANSATRAKA